MRLKKNTIKQIQWY